MRSSINKSRALHRMNRQPGARPGSRPALSGKTRLAAATEMLRDAHTDFFFITLFTQHRKNRFGQIQEREMNLNSTGQLLLDCWYELPVIFPRLLLDLFIIMPNHLHALLALPREAKATDPGKLLTVVIGEFVRLSAQALVTAAESQPSDIWRPDFQQASVQSESELNLLRDYIVDNPHHWDADPLNPHPKSRTLLYPPLGKSPQN